MSLSKQTLLDLMALADGELQGEARDRMLRLVSKDAEARDSYEAFVRLSQAVREVEHGNSPRIELADAVMARVASEEMGTLEGAEEPKVVRLRRAGAAAAVSTVLALAAGWFLFFRTESPVSKMDLSRQPEAKDEIEMAGETDLESADAPVSGVFYVTAGVKSQASSVVVWLGEE